LIGAITAVYLLASRLPLIQTVESPADRSNIPAAADHGLLHHN